MTVGAIFLPGITVPARIAYADLLAEIGTSVRSVVAVAKELEVYAGDVPPDGYTLDVEMDGVDRLADEYGFDRFHLYGQSIGGAVALAYAASRGDRLRSVAVNEPATDFSGADRAALGIPELLALPEDERMGPFVEAFVRPGVELGPARPVTDTPEMAKRPAGITAALSALDTYQLDRDALRARRMPAYVSYGSLSNVRWEVMAARLSGELADCTVERFEGRHHLDAPHQAEPRRTAAALGLLWSRAVAAPAG